MKIHMYLYYLECQIIKIEFLNRKNLLSLRYKILEQFYLFFLTHAHRRQETVRATKSSRG